MNFRTFVVPMAVALVATAALSMPSQAAMPAHGITAFTPESAIVQVAQKKKRMTRQQELDKSIDSGTVPSRYRANVPKQYHQYIPFAKQ